MITLGIDLATRDGRTGICEVEWTTDGAVAKVETHKPCPAELVVARIKEVRRKRDGWVAIDAPFGFPVAFTEAIQEWDTTGRVEGDGRSEHPEWLERINTNWEPVNRRLTDAFVRHQLGQLERPPGDSSMRWPLSVVVEQITPTAIRCAEILSNALTARPIDRIGAQRVVETYPVAALRMWRIQPRKYKTDRTHLPRVLNQIDRNAPWLHRDDSPMWHKYDDAIDALACAFVARLAAEASRESWPQNAGVELDMDVVEREGWIHLPPLNAELKNLFKQARHAPS